MTRKLQVYHILACSYARQMFSILRARLSRRYCIIRGLLFDVRYGTDTIKTREIANLDIAENARRSARKYRASKIALFHHVLRNLPASCREFTFVDVGCGKGLCLMLGAKYGFRHLIGIEISPELTAIAERNIARFRKRVKTTSTFELHCMDARQYPIPHGKAIYYFYNPFTREVMTAVLTNIRRSLAKSPREIIIIYVVPSAADAFDEADFLSMEKAGESCGDHFRIYSNSAAGK